MAKKENQSTGNSAQKRTSNLIVILLASLTIIIFASLATGLVDLQGRQKRFFRPIPPSFLEDKNINIKTDQLTLKTAYGDGVLQYSGKVQLPTPCHLLKDQSRVLESYPEQVQIRLTVERPAADLACIQVIGEKNFSGQIKVSPQAIVTVYLNGQRIR